ncbi:hypothetical protein JHK84_052870 [Glycine max]|nr:hypothetical protein JHK85_053699 [Glycine max]KAG5082832.1 hypothetical protein JHK84_052870 [Glycine max]
MAGRQDSNLGIFQQQGFHGNNSANLEGASGYRNQRSKKEPLHLQVIAIHGQSKEGYKTRWRKGYIGFLLMKISGEFGRNILLHPTALFNSKMMIRSSSGWDKDLYNCQSYQRSFCSPNLTGHAKFDAEAP